MKHFLFAAAVCAAAPLAAQVGTPEQAAGLAAASASIRALSARLAPAAVDPKPVRSLTDKLEKEGTQIEMEEGETGNLLVRQGPPDARGSFRNIQANLVEVPPPADESEGMVRDLVMRRCFSRLEATSDDWKVDDKTGEGRVDEWHYAVSLDGRLISVEHTIVPVELVAPGVAAPVEEKGRAYRMSPSDAGVLRRWRKLSRELLTLGRTVEA
ncbi:MAG TPA: hypothetical protein VN915_00210 [Elusimicrobiota bacterium]|nr:hypothetical protein [Elusimicrobiota bacterium]